MRLYNVLDLGYPIVVICNVKVLAALCGAARPGQHSKIRCI